jgi:hypothetical protein
METFDCSEDLKFREDFNMGSEVMNRFSCGSVKVIVECCWHHGSEHLPFVQRRYLVVWQRVSCLIKSYFA